MRKALLLLAVVSVALGGCARVSSGSSSGDASGIRGIALLGPQCPVEIATSPCPDKPFEATIQVKAPNGDVVATVTSGKDGRFQVAVAPGNYVLEGGPPKPGGGLTFAKPVDVTVRPAAFTEVTVSFDTGIR